MIFNIHSMVPYNNSGIYNNLKMIEVKRFGECVIKKQININKHEFFTKTYDYNKVILYAKTIVNNNDAVQYKSLDSFLSLFISSYKRFVLSTEEDFNFHFIEKGNHYINAIIYVISITYKTLIQSFDYEINSTKVLHTILLLGKFFITIQSLLYDNKEPQDILYIIKKSHIFFEEFLRNLTKIPSESVEKKPENENLIEYVDRKIKSGIPFFSYADIEKIQALNASEEIKEEMEKIINGDRSEEDQQKYNEYYNTQIEALNMEFRRIIKE
jgi:hypothetical protein